MTEETTPIIETLCPLCWRSEKIKVEGDLPCIECQEAMKKGFLCIGVDLMSSESAEKAVRTGHRWIISVEAAKALYNDNTIERGAGLLDIKEAKQLGLPVQTYAKPEVKPGLTLCGICNEPIHTDELGGIDPKHGFMHKKCTPLNLKL